MACGPEVPRRAADDICVSSADRGKLVNVSGFKGNYRRATGRELPAT